MKINGICFKIFIWIFGLTILLACSIQSNSSSKVVISRSVQIQAPILLSSTSSNGFPALNKKGWCSDYHIGPIADLKHVFSFFHVDFNIQSLSGHCHITQSCATNLKVLNRDNGYHLGSKDNIVSLSKKLFEAYKDDVGMRKIDFFVCMHPIIQCLLFLPFKKPIFMWSTTRYEHGAFGPGEWDYLNRMLNKISHNKMHFIGANSVYDKYYMEYFTGINVTYIPSFCGYLTDSYNPTRKEILISTKFEPYNILKEGIANAQQAISKSKYEFQRLRDLYPKYTYFDLASHPAIVYFPYQVSVMSFFEQYRMNIPIFAPSLKFLTELHMNYRILSERTWNSVFGKPTEKSSVLKHPDFSLSKYDPNDEMSSEAVNWWIQWADWYQFPYITLFDSFDDLIQKIENVDFHKISSQMKEYNLKMLDETTKTWFEILSTKVVMKEENKETFVDSFDETLFDV